MCGIAGAVSPDPDIRDERIVRSMLEAIQHRGPDDEGISTCGPGTLGVRRLSIIDIAGGHQPMANEDGTVFAIQNGELYNFQAIRAELAALGHAFRTRSDTEILPHAYEEWGADLVGHLRGMFAIAVWDTREQVLLLARDRFGKKPLAYARVGPSLIFASEIQGLLRHPAVPRDLDDEAISEYLTFGYVPAPRSAFAAIRKVPPAHALVFRDGHEDVRRYWALRFTPKLDIGADEAASELRRRIDEAVRIRLMSDVPLGAFLSGGLDSSTVVAFMARNSQRPVQTFSIGFTDHRFDELRYARIAARAFGTDHHELVVDAGDADVLPAMIRHLGEPFADSSIVPTYHVARITRQHVTVALNGDGGDELFAGYDRYKAAAIARLTTERLPGPFIAAVSGIAARISPSTHLPRLAHRARRFAVALALPAEIRHLRWTGYFTGDLRARIAGERLRASDEAAYRALREASELTGADDAAERYMAADIMSYLPNDLLVKMDIAAMANSLEGRSPLLDHELAEFVARLPVPYKLSPRTSKVLLRRAMKGILPAEILHRGKMGFSPPVGSWLRGPLRGLFAEMAEAPQAAELGYVDAAGVRSLFAEHVSGSADRTMQLWSLLMLELWLRELARWPAAARAGLVPSVA